MTPRDLFHRCAEHYPDGRWVKSGAAAVTCPCGGSFIEPLSELVWAVFQFTADRTLETFAQLGQTIVLQVEAVEIEQVVNVVAVASCTDGEDWRWVAFGDMRRHRGVAGSRVEAFEAAERAVEVATQAEAAREAAP